MHTVVEHELNAIAQTRTEEETGIEYDQVFNDFANEDFVHKNIRVRPVSGLNDETRDGPFARMVRSSKNETAMTPSPLTLSCQKDMRAIIPSGLKGQPCIRPMMPEEVLLHGRVPRHAHYQRRKELPNALRAAANGHHGDGTAEHGDAGVALAHRRAETDGAAGQGLRILGNARLQSRRSEGAASDRGRCHHAPQGSGGQNT